VRGGVLTTAVVEDPRSSVPVDADLRGAEGDRMPVGHQCQVDARGDLQLDRGRALLRRRVAGGLDRGAGLAVCSSTLAVSEEHDGVRA
jgi:hypothetical protein